MMDITKKISQTLGEEKIDEATGSNKEAYMAIAEKYAPMIAKEVSKYDRVMSNRMLANDVYNSILKVTRTR